MKKKVKIVATVGPATEDLAMLKKIISAGVNCIRINTAFRDPDYYVDIIHKVRSIAPIPIMLDLKGTDIRFMTHSSITVPKHGTLRVAFLQGEHYFSKDFYDSVVPGDTVYFHDGLVRSTVVSKRRRTITLRFPEGVTLENGTGINIPKHIELKPLLSKKDKAVIALARKHDVEYLALSFTKSKDDILVLRRAVRDPSIAIIAKIENQQGVTASKEILSVAEGIMVARGDLGIEIPQERVPFVQKRLIREANQAGKIVITATEMLQSMVDQPRPTRAETSDVTNAILDGTDAVMLSSETSVGQHPLAAVTEMCTIARVTQEFVTTNVQSVASLSDTITHSVYAFSHLRTIDKIVTITRSGFTARMIARFRPRKPILAVTRDEKVKRQLELVYGIQPIHVPQLSVTNQVHQCAQYLLKQRLLERNETVLFTGASLTKREETNTIVIVNIKDISKNS